MENKETNKEEFKDLKETMAKENIERQKTPVVRKFEVISYDKEESDRIISWAKKNEYNYARVKHDRDKKPDGTLKKTHYHTIVSMPDGRYMYDLAATLNVDLNRMEKPRTKKGQWENMLAYLGHDTPGAIAAGKPHYEPEEIEYNVEPYAEFLARYKAKGNEIEAKKNKEAEIEDIIRRITEGEITKWNQTEKIDPITWTKYKNRIKAAFEYYEEKIAATNANRKKQIYYYYGATGCGKSTLARHYGDLTGKSSYVSGASNDPFEGYRGQEILVIDEYKDNTMTAQDFLKLIDPNFTTAAKSRFSNKELYCSMIIITSNITPAELYKGIDAKSREAIFRKINEFWYFEKDTYTRKKWTGEGTNLETISIEDNPALLVKAIFEPEDPKENIESPYEVFKKFAEEQKQKEKEEYKKTEKYKQKKAAMEADDERREEFKKEAEKAGISLEEWYETMLPA